MNDEREMCVDEVEQVQEDERYRTCREELRTLQERYTYLSSDLENMRRRSEQDRLNYIRAEQMRVVRTMLPVMDDLERAIIQISAKGDEAGEVLAGILLVQRNFSRILEQYGVVAMKDIQQFDPHLHEAVMQVEKEDMPSGAIVEVFQKGYLLRGELLRPAQVSVVA